MRHRPILRCIWPPLVLAFLLSASRRVSSAFVAGVYVIRDFRLRLRPYICACIQCCLFPWTVRLVFCDGLLPPVSLVFPGLFSCLKALRNTLLLQHPVAGLFPRARISGHTCRQ